MAKCALQQNLILQVIKRKPPKHKTPRNILRQDSNKYPATPYALPEVKLRNRNPRRSTTHAYRPLPARLHAASTDLHTIMLASSRKELGKGVRAPRPNSLSASCTALSILCRTHRRSARVQLARACRQLAKGSNHFGIIVYRPAGPVGAAVATAAAVAIRHLGPGVLRKHGFYHQL